MRTKLNDGTEYNNTQVMEQLRLDKNWMLEIEITGNYTSQEIYNDFIKQTSKTITVFDNQGNQKIFNDYNKILYITANFNEEDLYNSKIIVMLGKE